MIEPLEARIAPAAVFTFTDPDGDRVTVKTSKGTNADLAAAGVLTFDTAADVPRQLRTIDLSANAVFAGTDLTITAARGPLGDGVTAVGFVNATALSLGKVTIDGDLGRILAGNAAAGQAVKALTVGSIGLLGTTTQAAGGNLASVLAGEIGTWKVQTDIAAGVTISAGDFSTLAIGRSLLGGLAVGDGKSVTIAGDVDGGRLEVGTIGQLRIGGSMIGGTAAASGAVSTGAVKTIVIGGDLRGGAGDRSAFLQITGGVLGTLDIRGSVLGGPTDNFSVIPTAALGGQIEIGGDVKTFKLAGELRAGAGDNTAIVAIGGTVGNVTIGGSIVGNSFASGSSGGGRFFAAGGIGSFKLGGALVGDGVDSGKILTNGAIGALSIGGDLAGGDGARSGVVKALGGITKSLTIGGSVRGGLGEDSGFVAAPGAPGKPAIVIRGDLRGGDGANSGVVEIDTGAGKVTIEGSVIGGLGESSGRFALSDSGFVGAKPPSLAFLLKGDLRGGDGPGSGLVSIGNVFAAKATVNGSVIGGAGIGSGVMEIQDGGTFLIGGSVVGGGDLFAGRIELNDVKTLRIRGDLRGSDSRGTGIITAADVGAITIGGSVFGGGHDRDTMSIVSVASLSIGGSITGTAAFPATIEIFDGGKVSVGGSVTFGRIHGGFDIDNPETNSDAQFTSVIIRGDFIASDLVVGVLPGAGNRFGDGNDTFTLKTNDDPSVVARIGSLVIGGRVRGTAAGGDTFGILAQEIGSFTVAGKKVALASGASNDDFVFAATGDLRVREF